MIYFVSSTFTDPGDNEKKFSYPICFFGISKESLKNCFLNYFKDADLPMADLPLEDLYLVGRFDSLNTDKPFSSCVPFKICSFNDLVNDFDFNFNLSEVVYDS